jgi:hypothetical protein
MVCEYWSEVGANGGATAATTPLPPGAEFCGWLFVPWPPAGLCGFGGTGMP